MGNISTQKSKNKLHCINTNLAQIIGFGFRYWEEERMVRAWLENGRGMLENAKRMAKNGWKMDRELPGNKPENGQTMTQEWPKNGQR